MQTTKPQELLCRLGLAVLLAVSGAGCATAANHADHHEFDASVHVPYRSDASARAGDEARTFTLHFEHPEAEQPQTVAWRLELLTPDNRLVQRWYGIESLHKRPLKTTVRWAGRFGNSALPDGIYQVRLLATANDASAVSRPTGAPDSVVEAALARKDAELVEQSWPMQVGRLAAPVMPAFSALPSRADQAGARKAGATGKTLAGGISTMSTGATGGLPYTVYYGNLHSQTNHSDGGGDVSTCTDSESPQGGQYGPADAFQYALNRGLDFLATSEHNHLFDGSTSANTSANPTTVKNLYQSGLAAASSFNATHPNFLAIYGMEWGVISNGGHLNIFNSNELLGWEYNGSNQLLADTFTAKTDYAALYTLMKQRGWVGQFNHPSTSGQFVVNGTALGYTADGDEAMALCEVLNTSAFSNNTTETETGRSTYEAACNKLLEAGYHIAFSSNQDNHCANWGASYTNRTGVLLPNGASLTLQNFVDALKARRVFATMDKNSQLILTANGHVMGERFTNSGPLTLTANFANSAGRTVSTVRIYEGVPKRNGTVTQLSSSATITITPSAGEHFYYAKVTQDDGKILWSAPVWVTQVAGGDTVAPTVSASESGSSGTITLSATASDNVGVSKVDFMVDNALKGTDASAPYSMTLDSTTLANGTHSLVAKAYDAAGNIGTSNPVSFSVSNAVASQLIANSGFESGSASWSATSGVITNDSGMAARSGTWKAWLNGYGSAHTDTLYQQVTIPSTATTATLSFWLRVASDETTTTQAYDTLRIQLRNSSNTVLTTLATYSNLNKGSSYVQRTFDVSAYKGQTIRVYFLGTEGSQVATSFVVDDVTLTAQ
ncbi:MAG TPA: CehA/McbA family metallohydrolase [Paucimonas sp.]|nr:CehA/McbA family metallohydrolase [Paucimonas sp.]